MVFERKHTKSDNKIADISGILDNYNNTNASQYINQYRMKQIQRKRNLKPGEGYDEDILPPDFSN